MPPEDSFGLAGKTIDQLRFEEAVGEGGFSVVYRGMHVGLDEPVAIKCLKLPTSLEAELVEQFILRFRAECKLCYRLSQGSLAIVRSVTSGTTYAPSGALVPYMALEWLEGRSLGVELRERLNRGESMTLEDAIALLDPAVQAIAHAHSQGIVHRDIKPGNIFVVPGRDGPKIKVLDFGLAKILHDEALGVAPSVKTTGAFFFASPSYGAPEQFDQRLGGVGPWTDVYALALVLMEMVLGRKVRYAPSMADAVILALDPKTDLSPHTLGMKVSSSVNAVLARAVSRSPEQRPSDASVFWGQLRDSMLHLAGPGVLGKTIAEDALPARMALEQALARAATPAAPSPAPAPSDPTSSPITEPLGKPMMGQTLRLDQAPPIPSRSSPPGPSATAATIAAPFGSTITLPGGAAAPAPPTASASAAPAMQRTQLHAPSPPNASALPYAPALQQVSSSAPPPRFLSDPPSSLPLKPARERRKATTSPWAYVLLTVAAVLVFLGGAWLGITFFAPKAPPAAVPTAASAH